MNEAPEKLSFDKPMRQAIAGYYMQIALELKKIISNFWYVFAIMIFKRSSIELGIYITVTSFVLLWITIFGYLKYRRIIFYIDRLRNEFIFQSGVFSKQSTAIRLDRIQQVEINQNVLQKLLNVYAVEVNTAGTAKAEVVIRAMKLADAKQLKTLLLKSRMIETPHISETPEEDTFSVKRPVKSIQLSFSTIFKIAATSNYGKSLALIIGFFGVIYNNLSDFFKTSDFGKKEIEGLMNMHTLLTYTWFMVLLLLVIWLSFNIINGVVRFYGYKISFFDRRFNIQFGLLKTRNTILHVEKVQVARIVSNYLQNKFNLHRLFFQQASSDFHTDKKANIEVPGCTKEQELELLNLVFGKTPVITQTILPNYRKLIPPIIKFIVIPTAIVLLWLRDIPHLNIWIPLWAVTVLIHDYFAFKNNKLFISEDFIVIRKGAWDVSRSMMETYKIQGISITQRLWHRRAGIAHITFFTAADNLEFRFVSLREINPYINKWLYDAEVSEKKWM